MVLREIEGYNYDDIATIGLFPGDGQVRINRGRKALRSELEKYGYGKNNQQR